MLSFGFCSFMHGWLSWSCDALSVFYMKNVGICKCSDGSCFQDQVVYRIEAAATLVFFFLLTIAVSGCGNAAATRAPFAKFLLVLIAAFVFLFIDNKVFTGFSTFAGIASGFFLMGQTLLIIHFAYTWNETWHTYARANGQEHFKSWICAILTSSVAMLFAAVAACVYLATTYDLFIARVITISSLILSFVLLGISTLEWCEHGALLTSAVMSLYSMWVSYEAIAVLPGAKDNTGLQPMWIGLLITAIALVVNASHAGAPRRTVSIQPAQGGGSRAPGSEELAHCMETGAPTIDGISSPSVEAVIDSKEFGMQCFVHIGAALYVCSVIVPHRDDVNFNIREAAIVTSLLLYGWSLVAPQVLQGCRSFD